MAEVPRIHDTLAIVPVEPRSDGTRWVLRDAAGTERVTLDEAGRFLVLQLDGTTDEAEVRARYAERFGRPLSPLGLAAIVERLDDAGLLNTNPRALWILRYLRSKGVRHRSPQIDRRADEARGHDSRREPGSAFTAQFDRAVYFLNEGQLERGLAMLQALTDAHPADLRLQEMVAHLRFLLASEHLPALDADRRDLDWEAFDNALTELLAQGLCPTCQEEIVVELGSNNHCAFCGAAFSSYVLDRSREERRVSR